MGDTRNRRFEEACAKIQQSLEKYTNDDFEESSEEEELENEPILSKVLDKYDNGNALDFEKTFQFLTDSIKAGSTICAICIRSVKRNNEIWSCLTCFSIFHLGCIQKWAKDSTYNQSSEKRITIWSCPKCRNEYSLDQTPSKYFCFCGKVVNPKPDLWTLPHSCGETCKKPLKPLCGHNCLLLCHPGKCPPCPKVVQTTCYCGKGELTPKRCSDKYWSCSQVCGKLLKCNQHKCEAICHPGDCPPCQHQSYQYCQCGSERSLRPCNSPTWKCKKVCKQVLSCGFHICEQICHSGDCGPCPLTAPRSCPCGKTNLKLPCTQSVEPCGDTCDKLLDCQIHTCDRMCHYGECSPCLNIQLKKCRCGLTEKNFVCSKILTCNIKCRRLKDCGKHACSRKCCDGTCPPCDKLCMKTLQCGNHKCQSICHRGPCFPCNETVDLVCACGKTKVTVPCGQKRKARPPLCKAKCKKETLCHHENTKPHLCHFGPCPPCDLSCGKIIPKCGHACTSKCHSAIIVGNFDEKLIFKKKARQQYTIISEECPPCKEVVQLACKGNHEIQEFPCSQVPKEWSCARLCNRKLSCTNHKCQLECHKVINARDEISAGDNCMKCELPCIWERPSECTHICTLPCHPKPCPPCMQTFKFRCHCQITLIFIPCHEYTSTTPSDRISLLSCSNRCPKELSCGHRCPNICHTGPCPKKDVCQKKVTKRCPCLRRKQETKCNTPFTLECDSSCLKILEEKKLAQEKEKMIKQEALLKQQKEEFEKYQRKLEGRRKNRRLNGKPTNEVKNSKFKKYFIILPILFLILAFLLYFLTKQ